MAVTHKRGAASSRLRAIYLHSGDVIAEMVKLMLKPTSYGSGWTGVDKVQKHLHVWLAFLLPLPVSFPPGAYLLLLGTYAESGCVRASVCVGCFHKAGDAVAGASLTKPVCMFIS